MIRAYVGSDEVPRGSGKTTSMVYDAKQYLIQNLDKENPYKVVSNIPLNFEYEYFSWKRKRNHKITFEVEVLRDKKEYFTALKERYHTLFLLDEAGIWLSNYEWKEVDPGVYDKFVQERKFDIHLFYTAQLFEFVNHKLQTATNPIVECQPWPRPDIKSLRPPPTPYIISQTYRPPTYYAVKERIAGDEQKERKYIKAKKWIFYSELKRIFPAFDTKLVVQR